MAFWLSKHIKIQQIVSNMSGFFVPSSYQLDILAAARDWREDECDPCFILPATNM